VDKAKLGSGRGCPTTFRNRSGKVVVADRCTTVDTTLVLMLARAQRQSSDSRAIECQEVQKYPRRARSQKGASAS
jgi:hypothetical protein